MTRFVMIVAGVMVFFGLFLSCEKKKQSEIVPIQLTAEKKDGVETVRRIVTDSVAVPDTVIHVDSMKYLAVVSKAGGVADGIYMVNASNADIDQLIGGYPSNPIINCQKDGSEWIYFSFTSLDRGVKNTQYTVVTLQKNGNTRSAIVSNLLSVEEDGESGGCGGSERAAEIGLQNAAKVDECSFVDRNGDGFTDVLMELIKENCQNGEKSREKRTFIFSGGKFVEETRMGNVVNGAFAQFGFVDSLRNVLRGVDDSKMIVNETSTKYSIGDFFENSVIQGKSSTGRKFMEIDECTGDSMFDVLYSNSIVGTEPIVSRWVYLLGAPATPKGLSIGNDTSDVVKIYGRPYKSNGEVFVYLCNDGVQGEDTGSKEYYEAVTMFFKNGKLIMITIFIPVSC